MKEFQADLHCHSTCSDGSLSPSEIVYLAKKIGLSGLSITDHDTVEAYSEAIPLCALNGISLLTGVEFSAGMEGISVHILAYGFKPDDSYIIEFCQRHSKRREERNEGILYLLSKNGMPILKEELIPDLPLAEGHRSIGRPHIAMAMVKKGYVSSIQEAFKKFLGEEKSCYTPGKTFSVGETIETIHKAKGIAVIAHPHLLKNEKILQGLLKHNFDGIECFYGKYLKKDHKRWLTIAAKKHWIVTGGSDFHGSIKPNIELGCSWIDADKFQEIQNKLNA